MNDTCAVTLFLVWVDVFLSDTFLEQKCMVASTSSVLYLVPGKQVSFQFIMLYLS